MPRLPEFNPLRPEDARQAEHHFEEYASGLDRTGPQFEEDLADEPGPDAVVRAAGATAYSPPEDLR